MGRGGKYVVRGGDGCLGRKFNKRCKAGTCGLEYTLNQHTHSLAFLSHRPTELTVCHCLCPCSPLTCSYELVMYRCQRRHCFPSDIWKASKMAFFTTSEKKQGGGEERLIVGQRIPPTTNCSLHKGTNPKYTLPLCYLQLVAASCSY